MAAVTSMSFTIATEGNPGIPIKNAAGKLLKSGDATGTIELTQSGQLAQLNFTLAGDSVYLKGPTGGYRKLPRAMVVAIYDPSAILDPNRGVAKLLSEASNPKTEAKESIAGEDAYKVKATLPKDAASSLVPGLSKDVTGEVWVGVSDHRLLKVSAQVPAASGGGTGTVNATFADFDQPFTIKAPTA
jgi:lipoprotein LprG